MTKQTRHPGRRFIATAALALSAALLAVCSGSSPSLDKPVSPGFMAKLQGASQAGLDYGTPIGGNRLQHIAGPPIASGNKAGVLTAEVRPYAGATPFVRWGNAAIVGLTLAALPAGGVLRIASVLSDLIS